MNTKLTHQSFIYLFTATCLSLAFFLTPNKAQGFLGLNDTAEIIPESRYKVGMIPQLYLGKGGGTEVGVFFDMFVMDDINARFEIGSGVTDFWAAGSAKWVPFPDYDKQPAIGVRGKFIYARELNLNFYNSQLAVIISKKFRNQVGDFIPYAGVPVTFVYEKNTRNFMASQLVLGSEWVLNKEFQMGAELDIDLAYTTTALSMYLAFQFDENIGFKK